MKTIITLIIAAGMFITAYNASAITLYDCDGSGSSLVTNPADC